MSPVATSDAAFRGGACPTPEYTVTYTGNYTTSADASRNAEMKDGLLYVHARIPILNDFLSATGTLPL